MIVNYDKESGGINNIISELWKSSSTKNIVSKEATDVFKNIIPNLNISDVINWDEIIKKNNIASDSLKNFLKDTNYAEKSLDNYQKYLRDTTTIIGKFSTALSKVGSVLKSVAGNLVAFATNAALMYGISKVIEIAVKAWEDYSNAQENAIEKGTEAFNQAKENAGKVKEAQKVLDDIKSNTVTLGNGTEITRFEQLSQGVNSLGQNVSLTTEEFEEYNSILDQMADAGIRATNSMSNLEEQISSIRKSANLDTISGLGDWVSSFNAKNNQNVTDFTKESGYQQQIEALDAIYASSSENIDDIQKVEKQSWWDNFVSLYSQVSLYQTASQTLYTEASNQLQNMAQTAEEERVQLSTYTDAIEEIADRFDIDIYDDAGEFDYEKISSVEVQKQLEDARQQLVDTVEAEARQSSEFLKALFENDSSYGELSETATQLISGIFENIDYNTISESMMDSNGMLSQRMMRDWVSGLTENMAESDVQSQLEELFNLNSQSSSLTYSQYLNRANKLIEGISTAVPQLTTGLLKQTSGVADVVDETETLFNKIKTKFPMEKISDLSLDEIEIGANILAEDNFSGTFDEFISEIDNARKVASKPIDIYATPKLDSIASALESENAGTNYESIIGYIEQARELYNQGLVGTDEFKAIASFLSPTGAEDATNFEENIGKAMRYFTEDDTGVKNFLADLEALEKGYVDTNSATGEYLITIEDLEQAASDMGMGFEAFMSVFGRLEDYDFAVDAFSSVEDGMDHLGELYKERAAVEMRLSELQDKDGYMDGNATAIAAAEEELAQYNARIQSTIGLINQLSEKDLSTYNDEVTAAKDAIQSLVDSYGNADQYGENADAIQNKIISTIQTIASDNGIDISEWFVLDDTGNILGLVGEVESTLQENPVEVPANIKIANEQQTNLENQSNTENNSIEIEPVPVSINYDLFNQSYSDIKKTVEDTTMVASLDGDPAELYQKHQEAIALINNPVVKPIEPNTVPLITGIERALGQQFSINVKANISGLPSEERANGTPFIKNASFNDGALGHAYAVGGTVGEPSDTVALTGELGQELVVRGNRFFTVGDNGAEFARLKKGDIVFNHQQTKELLSKGYIKNRGKALLDGNARAMPAVLGSSGNKFKGGVNGKKIDESGNAASKSLDNLATSADKASDSADEASSALDKLLEKLDNLIDWIEYRRNYLSGEIDYKLAQSENATGYTKKNKKVSIAQSITSSLIEVDKKALKKYEQHAESIRKEIGLSESLAKKVREGTIEIETLSEDDKKRVEKYQEWYDKIKVCRDEIEELNTSLKELAQQKIDNITEQFDAVLEKIDHRKNTIDSFVENAQLKGYVESTKYYDKLIKNENKTIAQLTKERDAMQKSFDESVASGAIKKGSLEYKQMQNEINGVTEEINEATNAALELANTARQIKWDRFDSTTEGINTIVDEAEFLLGLLDSEDMYNEKGNVTAEGKATYGLNAVKYQTALDQVERARLEQKELDLYNEDGTYNQDALKRWQELEKVIQENASAADDAKESMKELVKEGIEAQLSALKELIDEYMEALKSQKELYDYQQDISEKTEEISKLQKRLAVYSGDDSEEGRLKRQQTEEELKKAQKELEETEYDKFISDQEELLNNLFDDFEEALNKRLDNFDETFEAIQKGISDNADIIKTTLENQVDDVGAKLSTTMSNIWGEAGSNGILSSVDSGVQSIVGFMEILTKQADQNSVGNTGTDKEKQSAIKSLMSQGTKHEGSLTDSEKKTHSDLWEYLVEEYGYTPYTGVTTDLANVLGVELSNAETPTSKDKANVLAALKKLNGDDKKTSTQSAAAKDTAIKTLAEKYKVAPSDAIIKELARLLRIEVSSKLTDAEKLKVLDALKIKGYAKGTDYVKEDEWANISELGAEIITLPDGSFIYPIKKGSGVINHAKTEEITSLAENHDRIMDVVNNSSNMLNRQQAMLGDTQRSLRDAVVVNNNDGRNINVTNEITFELPGVTTYEDFMTKAQHDSRFEKMIQTMSIGRVNGQSKLAKYNYKW